jgi:hypothetical protein
MKELIKKVLKESLIPESAKGGTYHVYHGSKTEFSNFTDEFVGGKEANDKNGPGVYFTNVKEEAEKYGEFVYSTILTPRLLLDEKPPKKNLIPMFTKLIKMVPDWEMYAQDYDENPVRGLQIFFESIFRYEDSEKDALLELWNIFYKYAPVNFVRNCVSVGIDGIISNNDGFSTHYIIYNPNIIKNN